MFNNYEFFSPVRILSGIATLKCLPEIIHKLDGSSVFIMTDKGISAANAHEPVINVLNENTIPFVIFDDIPPDGSVNAVYSARELYEKHRCNLIIAIGGGSVIDTSKALNIAVTLPGDLEKYLGVNNLPHRIKPSIIIPTTAGTGSEVTAVAVVADKHKKLIFNSPYLMADYALLDPLMTLNLPLYITAMTAMDALTHCIEAYTCNGRNPISSELAFSAIKKILLNLPIVMKDSQNLESRLALAEASTMAGMAFSNSMVGLTHSLAHALGVNFKVPHGLCCSIFLPHVLEFNKNYILDELSELSLLFLTENEYKSSSKQNRVELLIKKISQLKQELEEMSKLPSKLRSTNKVQLDDFNFIAKKALVDGSIIYNPVKPTRHEVIEILEKAW
ncbi:iron-containing alcohol dehydrogenase [Acinetobacter baumannii]|uniref:iron-containing alcohol dehydrogenase n=1 Tax=Acinetobacter baumannii TaxID=470 RepID=UPI0014615942|nr:iron-containing alcohol dehydrogenase [Acinetobacter baumannii]MBJ9497592.1 iron-containing alcohol dehydrogenase [Acinetobacter baumannii]MBJ9545576.1 iron-containing alcohol dehydrogenase [Acinetobacter baumannii]NMR37868.1 iron-containing alcohol dehydrogenase [Acinetobacter baumannii]